MDIVTEYHVNKGIKNANPEWVEKAFEIVKQLAAKPEPFTSREVMNELEQQNVATHDKRAVGGVMKQAEKAGIISFVKLVRRNDKYSRGSTVLWKGSNA